MPDRPFPDPVCQDCGKESHIFEMVGTLPPYEDIENQEVWVYCELCETETIHPYGNNTVDS